RRAQRGARRRHAGEARRPMTASGAADPRLAVAARALAGAGVADATVTAAGHEGEIAVVTVPRAGWPRLFETETRAAVAAVKAAGFRYVALDLDPGAGAG